LRDDLAGDGGLAAQRIERHRRPREVQHAQQRRDGGERIRLLRDRDLAKDQPTVAGPGADQVHGRLPAPAVVRPTQRLPVEGHDLPGGIRHRRPHPGQETRLECLGIQRREDPPERVVAGEPARQRQEGPQPRLLRLGKGDHAHEALRAADDRA